MNGLVQLYYTAHNAIFPRLACLDGLPLLALRLILFFPFLVAGEFKIMGMDDPDGTITYFANLGIPAPEILAPLAAYTEFIGAYLLLLGLATRWISIPLIITMIVAIFAVHWDNGWAAIANSTDQEIGVRLDAAKNILREHGNYSWLTEKGSLVILNNGIEFAATYLVMLFVLLFNGGGRYTSVDYYLGRMFADKS